MSTLLYNKRVIRVRKPCEYYKNVNKTSSSLILLSSKSFLIIFWFESIQRCCHYAFNSYLCNKNRIIELDVRSASPRIGKTSFTSIRFVLHNNVLCKEESRLNIEDYCRL